MNHEQIGAFSILILIIVLMIVSLLAFAATIVFRKRMSVETAHVLFGLFPLEFCILFFGTAFLLVASFFLSRSLYRMINTFDEGRAVYSRRFLQ